MPLESRTGNNAPRGEAERSVSSACREGDGARHVGCSEEQRARRGPTEPRRVPASPGESRAGWAARASDSREPRELMLSSPSSRPTSFPFPIPWVIHDGRQPLAPERKRDARYRWGGSTPKDALSSKPSARWQAQGASPFQIHKIDAVLYSKTFKHQTGNLSSFMVAES